MKKMFVFLLSLSLLACSEAEKSASTDIPEAKPAVEPEAVGLASGVQKQAYDTTITYSTSDFAGKLFVMGQSDAQANCSVISECDCCVTDLLFLDDDIFVLNSPCQGSEYISRGKYSIGGREMTLHFEPLFVTYEYNWERENDSTAVPYFLKEEKRQIDTLKFSVASCQSAPVIITKSVGTKVLKESEAEIGRENKEVSLAEKVNDLKEKGIWRKLQL